MNLIPWNRKQSEAGMADPADLFRRQMDRLFEDFLGSWPVHRKAEAFVPALDVSENEKEVLVSVELPGMSEKDVEVSFSSGHLVISGEKSSEREEKGRSYHLVERSSGSFSRVVDLGDSVDPDKASATFSNGVLSVRVPKAEGVKPKRIAVKTG